MLKNFVKLRQIKVEFPISKIINEKENFSIDEFNLMGLIFCVYF